MGILESLFVTGVVIGFFLFWLILKIRKKSWQDASLITLGIGVVLFLISILAIGGFDGMPLGSFSGGIFCVSALLFMISVFRSMSQKREQF